MKVALVLGILSGVLAQGDHEHGDAHPEGHEEGQLGNPPAVQSAGIEGDGGEWGTQPQQQGEHQEGGSEHHADGSGNDGTDPSSDPQSPPPPGTPDIEDGDVDGSQNPPPPEGNGEGPPPYGTAEPPPDDQRHGYVQYDAGYWDESGYCFPPPGQWDPEVQAFDWGQSYKPASQSVPSEEHGYQPQEAFIYEPPSHNWYADDEKTYKHCSNYMVDMARWKFDQHMVEWNVGSQYEPDYNYHWGQIHYAAHYMQPDQTAHWYLHVALQKFKAWYYENWSQYPEELVVLDTLMNEAWGVFANMEHHYVSWGAYETMQNWYHTARQNGLQDCQDAWETSSRLYNEGPAKAAEYAGNIWNEKYKDDETKSQEYDVYFNDMEEEFAVAARLEADPDAESEETDGETETDDESEEFSGAGKAAVGMVAFVVAFVV